jgi:MOSC domain-containing protein YiiM
VAVAQVIAVHRSATHTFSKVTVPDIRLIAGIGVAGDAHAGETVRHRSRIRRGPAAPNLRQVHLLATELHDELRASGLRVRPGEMGENITTSGVDLLALSTGTLLHLGNLAVVEVTGLRNPCRQLNSIQPGLMAALVFRDEQGQVVRRAGVMAVVREGGEVHPGDPIEIEPPAGAYRPLTPV